MKKQLVETITFPTYRKIRCKIDSLKGKNELKEVKDR